jgi:hypothetical protein
MWLRGKPNSRAERDVESVNAGLVAVVSGRARTISALALLAVGVAVGLVVGHRFLSKAKTVYVPVRLRVPIEQMNPSEMQEAQRFAPLLVLNDDKQADPWRPQAVHYFICHSALSQIDATLDAADEPGPDTTCPPQSKPAPPTARGVCAQSWPLPVSGASPPRCKLDLPGCKTIEFDCYAQKYATSLNPPQETMYVRLLRRLDPRGFTDAALTQVPLAGRAATLARVYQYWFFYPYDSWHQGSIRQVHEGDWEWAMVGVDVNGRGLFVSYSQHCFGGWQWFDDPGVRLVSFSKRAEKTHPAIFVARGSHANYASAGTWNVRLATCVAKASVRSKLNHDLLLNDRTVTPAYAGIAIEKAHPAKVTRFSENMTWLFFAGPWGESEKIHVAGGWHAIGAGPAGPVFHAADWGDPVRLALCSTRWFDGNRNPKADHVCVPPVESAASGRGTKA